MAKKKPKKTTIDTGPGKSNISFKPGGLHQSLGVPQGKPIPQSKIDAAKAGKYGPKAAKQANLAEGLKKMRPSKPSKPSNPKPKK